MDHGVSWFGDGRFSVATSSSQASLLSGKWFVLPDGKSTLTVLTLSQRGDSISGKWAPPKGEPCEIENSKVVGDTLTFSFIQDKKHFDAIGHFSGDTMSFEFVGPKKWGKPETIHGQAVRGDGQ